MDFYVPIMWVINGPFGGCFGPAGQNLGGGKLAREGVFFCDEAGYRPSPASYITWLFSVASSSELRGRLSTPRAFSRRTSRSAGPLDAAHRLYADTECETGLLFPGASPSNARQVRYTM